jgi:sodium/proline symporter
MNVQTLGAFFVYFCILLAIGLIAYRKQNTDADFIIGNRSLNFWLTALSAHASDMSAWLFMAFPAAIFSAGLPQMWLAFGLVIGMFFNWHCVAEKLRNATEKYESYTLSTYFERRFNDRSGVIRILTASMAIVFLTTYLSAGLIAMGLLFESIFGIDYYIGLSIATFVGVVYTFSGGFITVAWTDLFQAIFLLFVIILVPCVAFFHIVGGTASIESLAHSKDIALSLLPDASVSSILTIIFLVLGWGLGYFGQPHIVTKFMGIKRPEEMYKSKYLGITWQIMALTAAAAVGLVGIGFFPDGLDNSELVFVKMVQLLFNPFFAGIILCGLIAANMSTMDSQILVCASVLSEDFYKHMVRKQASPQELLKASRISVIIVSFIALLLAFDKSTTVLAVVSYAWSGLGCAFGPLVLMSLYSKSTNKYGAIAGIFSGGVIAGFWPLLNPYITVMAVPSMIPGFFISIVSIIVVSRLTSKRVSNEMQVITK